MTSSNGIVADPKAIRKAIMAARRAQGDWQRVPLRDRARCAAALRVLIAKHAEELMGLVHVPQRLDATQTLTSEILPLCDAARWLGRRAPKLLASHWLGMKDRAWWLGRLQTSVHREPWGVVLVLGASNYPLFLAGVQALQALVAGNAICLKPAVGNEAVATRLVELFLLAGFPPDLIVQLGSDPTCGETAMAHGVDRVVLTGSSNTGRKVAQTLAASLVPATLELGGCDSMLVLSSANLTRVVQALLFGLRWNSGATCIAPRRILVMADRYDELASRLTEEVKTLPPQRITVPDLGTLRQLVRDAVQQGASLIGDLESPASQWMEHYPGLEAGIQATGVCRIAPVVLRDVESTMKIAQSDLFAPLVLLIKMSHWTEGLRYEEHCSYALGSSIFGEQTEAELIASYARAGSITINDLIVPTADPRVPFGGRGASGYGVTRGAAGLLEMTRPKVIARRRGNWLPHLDPPQADDTPFFLGMIQFLHGESWRVRWRGLRSVIEQSMQRRKKSQNPMNQEVSNDPKRNQQTQ